jgi:hypothetical protein
MATSAINAEPCAVSLGVDRAGGRFLALVFDPSSKALGCRSHETITTISGKHERRPLCGPRLTRADRLSISSPVEYP